MPCVIIITGHPCSGKTTLSNLIRQRALLWKEHPQEQKRLEKGSGTVARIDRVIQCNETSACPDHPSSASCTATSAAEKKTRGAIKAALDRAVAQAAADDAAHRTKTLIVLDATNYIKGFRYELYCIAKAAACRHYCVLWCLNSVPTVRLWNNQVRHQHQQKQRQNNKDCDAHVDTSQAIASNTNNDIDDVINDRLCYSNELLEALILRYELPDERNRWDRPLFRIDMQPQPDDDNNNQQPIPDTSTTANTTNEAAAELLRHSVYNMHNLSQAMAPTTSTPVGLELPLAKPIHTQSSSSAFKKSSAFQKRKPAAAANSTTPSTAKSTTTSLLTAESLSQLSTSLGVVDFNPLSLPLNDGHQQEPAMDANSAVSTMARKTTTTNAGAEITLPVPSESLPLWIPLEHRIDAFLEQFLSKDARLREGKSTRQHMATESNFLHTVDVVTQQLCSYILPMLEKQNVKSNHKPPVDEDAPLPSWAWGKKSDFEATLAQQTECLPCLDIRQIRQQYMQWVVSHPPSSQRSNHNLGNSSVDNNDNSDVWTEEQRIAWSFWEYLQSKCTTPTSGKTTQDHQR